MHLKKYIPNFFTCLNLFAGSVAIVFVFQGQLHISAILVGVAAIFDFIDGFSARLLKAYSELGKELDSLADLVTFGFAPSAVVFSYLQQSTPEFGLMFGNVKIISLAAFIIVIFSALRLAKFNTDQRQKDSFIGLPTPANAILIMSIPFLLQYGRPESPIFMILEQLTTNTYSLLIFSLITSFLLVSEIPLFSMKFKNYKYTDNKEKYIFLSGVVILFVVFGFFALPLVIIYYIILSLLINNIFTRRNNRLI
jgi:CDP-diacylglycerol---serine O-phosphatidyltransferase